MNRHELMPALSDFQTFCVLLFLHVCSIILFLQLELHVLKKTFHCSLFGSLASSFFIFTFVYIIKLLQVHHQQ